MKKGFTLIELLAVVLIVGILTAISLPQYRKSLERTRVAEARQMLPAIYDACDRIVAENGCSSWASCNNKLTFSKLDISFKGGPDPEAPDNPKIWVTPNFKYYISSSRVVFADIRKGRWKDTRIYYYGDRFTCTRAKNDGAAEHAHRSEACDFLGLSDKGE